MRKTTLRSDAIEADTRAGLRRATGLFMALLIASAALLATGTPASADADCYRDSCNGRSPNGTNCATTAEIVEVDTDGLAVASLLHSDLCDASWAVVEVHGGSPDEFGGAYYVPQLGGTETEVNIGLIRPGSSGTSTMINDQDSVKSCFTPESTDFDPDPEPDSTAILVNGGCTRWH